MSTGGITNVAPVYGISL